MTVDKNKHDELKKRYLEKKSQVKEEKRVNAPTEIEKLVTKTNLPKNTVAKAYYLCNKNAEKTFAYLTKKEFQLDEQKVKDLMEATGLTQPVVEKAYLQTNGDFFATMNLLAKKILQQEEKETKKVLDNRQDIANQAKKEEAEILQLQKEFDLSRQEMIKFYYKNNKDIQLTKQAISHFMNGAETAGLVYGNVSAASTNYAMDKMVTPRGHGFAAERANHLVDTVKGKQAVLVGDEIDPTTGRIIKNGADRVVDGVQIQTKYCRTGSDCIKECIENGKFKYINPDGTPMQIEVPSDKFDDAVRAMENRIRKGEVPGVTDPKDAPKYVKKGAFTYEQVKNIAKAGTVESIAFDAANGAIISASAFGITAVVTFATSIWNGDDFELALKTATYSGLKVGGTTFVTSLLSSQLSKTGLNSMLVGSSEAIVQLMGPKASAMLVNAFRSGTNIYGAAAMKSAAKLLRGNAITGAVTVVVLSSVDVVNIFRGRISGAQLFKNVANTTSTVAGGTAGWVGGATAGAAIGSAVPIIGTAIGGILGGLIGSFAGGAAAGKVSSVILDEFIEDDADKMVKIIENQFVQLAEDYLLNEKEVKDIVNKLKVDLTGGTLKDMFASSSPSAFAKDLLIPHVESVVKKRPYVKLPSTNEMIGALREILEDME